MAQQRWVPTQRSPGLVFACIAPHGDLAIPEAAAAEHAALATATQAGMLELAQRIDAVDPDVVIVLTPHGIHVEGHFAVAVAGHTAGALDEAPEIALDVPIDRDLSLGIVRELRSAALPVVGVSYGGNDPAESVMPMDWGTLIPLWYLGGRRDPPRAVVIVAPARDLTPEDHIAAGKAISEAVSGTGRRAGLIASADQSHTHQAEGPYGLDPGAGILDQQIVTMLQTDRLGALRDLDPRLIEAAKPDSWWQMLMLVGAIGESWQPELISYEAPTYYGMLCAAFAPR